ncbi:MAG: ABC transporter substrate-binding protein [Caldilineaceae bacterium]|nr:ABC transporter substrate-binding protein [Caldilineaceae bacterium]
MKQRQFKQFLSMCAVIVLLLCGLAACAVPSTPAAPAEGETTTATPETSAEETEGAAVAATETTPTEGATTRTVSTELGDIEVPLDPQRVVINWYVADGFTLGLPVVGYSGWAQETMPFYDQFEGVTEIENWEAEDILALEPDLIISWTAEDFDRFSKIAPVLVYGEGDPLSRLRAFGEATGRTAEAEAAIATFEEKLAAAKEQLTGEDFKDKTFSILQDWGASSYGVYYETGSRGGTLLYNYLGLQLPESLKKLVEESGEGRGSLSYEVAADYFGDYVIWFLMEDYVSEFAQSEIWQSIPAVQEGHIVEIPGNMLGLFYYDDVSSLIAQLDYIIEALNAVVQ